MEKIEIEKNSENVCGGKEKETEREKASADPEPSSETSRNESLDDL